MIKLKQKLFRAAAILIAAALCLIPVSAAAPNVSAAHAIVTDADTGAVLYEKDADAACLIASTTKIMTGLLICEQCDLREHFVVPREAVGVEGSSMYLKAGEVLSVRDLLYGMLLQSGNDAAVALAVHCSGSVERFAEEMNKKAKTLGMQTAHFSNPHGLDDEGNHASARDLATLTAYALRNPDFAQIVSTRSYIVGDRSLTNHNKLLWRYEGAIGVKTGYTKAAGRILVSAAEKNGRTLICVTIGAPDDWNDHQKLLDYGFSQYRMADIAEAGAQLCEVPVAAASAQSAPLIAKETVQFPLLTGEQITCGFRNEGLCLAPFLKGDSAGTAVLYLGKKEIAAVPVIWGATVLS